MFVSNKKKSKEVCFCAFCRNPHRIYKKKGIGILHVFLSLMVAVFFMWSFWGQWNAQAIPLFLICLFLGEVLMHFRWRLALICRQCGFDPLIYQKSHRRAAEKVRLHLERRKSDPRFLLAPPLQLPKQRKEASYP